MDDVWMRTQRETDDLDGKALEHRGSRVKPRIVRTASERARLDEPPASGVKKELFARPPPSGRSAQGRAD